MRKLYIRNVLVGLSFIFVLSSAIMSASGPGGGYSNAPGDQGNCTNCHTGSIVTSGNSNLSNIRLSSNFPGNGYVPDSTYTMELTFKQTGRTKFGFQVTCLDANDVKAGTLTSTNTRTSKTSYTPTGGSAREYIEHTSTGTANVGTDSTRWVFQWKAPSTNIGRVKFHVVVMATNNNSTNDGGDIVYGKTFNIDPSSLLPVAKASSNDTNTCVGYTVQLNGSGTNTPTSYTWKLTGGTPTSSTAQNPTVVYTLPGTKQAILTVKNSLGSSRSDTLDIVVLGSPTTAITPSSPSSICKGDSLQLTATGSNITYQWLHNNKTTRTVFVKDSGTYQVKVTSTQNGCQRTSLPFKLNWYNNPVVSISKSSTSDSFCGSYSETFTASGTDIDSVLWYVNGTIVSRTKTLSTVLSGTTNSTVYAIAKSVNGCKSAQSNSVNLVIVQKLFPSAIVSSKTTSTITVKWKNTIGISSYMYSVDNGSFSNTNTDSSLELSGLSPNTNYTVTLRAMQSSPCGSSDIILNIKTNACSNIQYVIDFNSRACLGTQLTATLQSLYKASYSVSFNNGPFTKDTIYSFTPSKSDSLTIAILDSLSPTCPAIIEKLGYTIDTLIDKDPASGAKSVSLCNSSYTLQVKQGYTSYSYFKNNILLATSALSFHTYTGLVNGDVLTAKGKINTCERTYGPVDITINPLPDAGFTFKRDWKTYEFTADVNNNTSYLWKTGNVVLGNSATFTKDMSAYINSSIDVVLITENSATCKDSSTQTLQIPNFTSIETIGMNVFKIYPNPFSSSIFIESITGSFEVQVIDHLGRIITNFNSNETTGRINSDEWAEGIYHIIVKDNAGNSSTFTMVKTK